MHPNFRRVLSYAYSEVTDSHLKGLSNTVNETVTKKFARLNTGCVIIAKSSLRFLLPIFRCTAIHNF